MTAPANPLVAPEDLAVTFRDRAYELMDHHPIAAAHLVLAAASLAPTCDDERQVAEHFTYLSPTSRRGWRAFTTGPGSQTCNVSGAWSMGLDDRDYMRERYRKRQGLGPEKTQWNDRAARVEMASGAWFASKDQGFDYQKGRHRLAPVFRPHPAQKWIFALSALLALIPAYREAKRNGWLPDFEAAQPFPGSGSVTVSRSVNPRHATAHLRVVTAKANAVVQLYDPATDRHVISVYVARDDDVTVPVPPGPFRMRLVEGDKWHGRTRYFGSSTTSDTVVGMMTFDRHTTRGVDLHRRSDGNLPTGSTSPTRNH